jgi:cell division protein FtsL
MPTTVTMTGPGTTTIVDDAALAIGAQTTAIGAELVFMSTDLFYIRANLETLAEQSKVQSKALSDLSVSIAGLSAATSNLGVIQAAAASNQIQTNNFKVAATKQTMVATGQTPPTMPPIPDQMKDVITNSMVLNAAATTEGAITNFITTQAAAAQSWIIGTEVYKDVAGWLKKQKDLIVAAVFPPSPKAVAQSGKALSGTKDPSE